MSNILNDSARLLAARRRFLASTGLAGLGLLGLNRLGTSQVADPAANGVRRRRSGRRDADILNFALNLEYLEAEFYLRAAYGRGLNDADTDGVGDRGGVTARATNGVAFDTPAVMAYAEEIALDEEAHVKFLRTALGDAAVARPAINLRESFTAAAVAAGVIQQGQTFDPFADENSFLLAAFIFEDVGVTAYAGAAPLLLDRDIISAAAGILAVEAYHAANIRTVLFAKELNEPAGQISDARDTLDGADADKDQGIGDVEESNIVPADENGLAFARTPTEVLNIVYLNPNTRPGGFFPQGVNGRIR